MHKSYLLEEFSLIVFLDGLPESLKDNVTAVEHKGNQLKVSLLQPLSYSEEQVLGQYVSAHDVNAPLSATAQKQKDLDRYTKRAAARDLIVAELAAENMERVRAGDWTTPELISLTQDAELKNLLDDINTLSYEIAYSKVDSLSNPLLTAEIKNGWKAKLLAHFYI